MRCKKINFWMEWMIDCERRALWRHIIKWRHGFLDVKWRHRNENRLGNQMQKWKKNVLFWTRVVWTDLMLTFKFSTSIGLCANVPARESRVPFLVRLNPNSYNELGSTHRPLQVGARYFSLVLVRFGPRFWKLHGPDAARSWFKKSRTAPYHARACPMKKSRGSL